MKRKFLSIVKFAALAVIAAGPTVAGPIAFAAIVNPSGANQFGVADLATGNFTQIGADFPFFILGIGYGPGGQLFGLDDVNNLIRIDRTTGAYSVVGNTGIPADFAFLAGTASGALYGVGSDNVLYGLNALTGAATTIGSTGVPATTLNSSNNSFSGLVAIGNTLYFTYESFNIDSSGSFTSDITPASLYILNSSTGAATKISDLMSLTNVFAGFGNQLYAQVLAPDLTAGPSLETINPATGVPTVIGANTSGTFFAEAVDVPEPSTAMFLAAGLLMLGLSRRKGRGGGEQGDRRLYKQSSAHFTLAAQLNPTYYSVFLSWGHALSDLARKTGAAKDYTVAFEKYRRAAEIQPTDIAAQS